MLELAYMSIEGMTEREREVLYTCVAPERQRQLLARKNRLSADLSLAGEVLARVMLWKAVRKNEGECQAKCDCIPDDFAYSGGVSGRIRPKEFCIVRDADGKPYQETVPGLFFNYSHSGTMVACGIAGEAIGVDIQKLVEGNKVRKKVYCTEEWEEERASGNPPCFFTEVWTKKESYLKLTGEGLRREMKSLNVRKMQEKGDAQWYGGWISEDFCMYACVEGDQVDLTGGTNGLSRNGEVNEKKENTVSMCQIRLSEMIDWIKIVQET